MQCPCELARAVKGRLVWKQLRGTSNNDIFVG
jgi:hypothetical protein